MVEKIAHEYWRLGIAASHETAELGKEQSFMRVSIDKVLRYQTTINGQLFQAINQLERLQRLRRGEEVSSPVSVQVSGDVQVL